MQTKMQTEQVATLSEIPWHLHHAEISLACKKFWERRGMQEPGMGDDLGKHWFSQKKEAK
jgi:hypothetical protein